MGPSSSLIKASSEEFYGSRFSCFCCLTLAVYGGALAVLLGYNRKYLQLAIDHIIHDSSPSNYNAVASGETWDMD